MMTPSYKLDELGELQQEILKHMFTCPERLENVSHISRTLGNVSCRIICDKL